MGEFYGLHSRNALRQMIVWTLGSGQSCGIQTGKHSVRIGNSASDFNFYIYPECPNSVFRNIQYFSTDRYYKKNPDKRSRELVTSDKSVRISYGYLVYNTTVVPCLEFDTSGQFFIEVNNEYYTSDKIQNINNSSMSLELEITTHNQEEFKLKSFSKWENIVKQLELQNITEYI